MLYEKKPLNDGLENFVAQKICVIKDYRFLFEKVLYEKLVLCTLYVFMFTFSKRIKFIRFNRKKQKIETRFDNLIF